MNFTRESKSTFICMSEKKEECNSQGGQIDLKPKGNYNKEVE